MNTVWMIARKEMKLLAAERTLWVVAGLLTLVSVYSLVNGLIDVRERESVIAGIKKQQAERVPQILEQLKRVMAGSEAPDPFANPVDPASAGSGGAGRHAIMPYTALAPIAFGQSDMLPNYYRISYRSKSTFMDDGELENPWNLLTGRFDFAFVIVVLLPLTILALTYNLISSEREQSILRLLLAQGGRIAPLIWGKLIARAGLVLAVVLSMAVAALAWSRALDSIGSWLALGSLVLLVIAYAAFWFALAVAVNLLNRSSAFNAIALMATWVLLVLVLPVAMNLAVQSLSPAPSRTEFATQTRNTTIEGLNRYNDLLSADYRYIAQPEVLRPKADGSFEVQPRRRAHYLLARDVDASLDAAREQFDAQLQGQQRWVDRLAFLSPAVVAFEGMAALAGRGASRYLHFKDQVDAFHREWKQFFEPRVLGGRAMTSADYAALPKFEWREEASADARLRAALRVLMLLVPTLLLSVFAWRRLRHVRVV